MHLDTTKLVFILHWSWMSYILSIFQFFLFCFFNLGIFRHTFLDFHSLDYKLVWIATLVPELWDQIGELSFTTTLQAYYELYLYITIWMYFLLFWQLVGGNTKDWCLSEKTCQCIMARCVQCQLKGQPARPSWLWIHPLDMRGLHMDVLSYSAFLARLRKALIHIRFCRVQSHSLD